MAIQIKLSVALAAYQRFLKIGKEKLPPKASYRVGRVIAKLRSESNQWDETQLKLLREHGGVETPDGMVSLREPEKPVRQDGESDADFSAKTSAYEAALAAHKQHIKALNDAAKQVMEEEVKIDYDPIPLEMFEVREPDPEDHQKALVRSTIEPNDMSFILDFVRE